MKTSELTGPALDWAVAKCEGLLCFGYRSDGERFAVENNDSGIERFMPSTSWQESGPIIERENIALWPLAESQGWGARKIWGIDGEETGYTPLIAAMRCYVASCLGNDVEIPEELKE